jgi:hypothetical protein
MRLPLVSLIGLLLLASLALPGQASVSIQGIQAPVRPIQPDVETAPLSIWVAISCNEVFPFGGTLEYTLNAPAGVIITGPTTQDVPACTTPQGFTEVENKFMVAMTREVPGLEVLKGYVKVHLQTSQFVLPTGDMGTTAEAPFAVAAGAYFITSARAIDKIIDCGCGGPVQVPLFVSNLGNVRTLHHFTLDGVVANGTDAPTILVPEALILGSATSGMNNNGTVFATVEVPSSGQVAFTVRVDTASADDPSLEGKPVFVNFLVRSGTGLDAEAAKEAGIANVPSVGPLAVLAILGMALVVARRRA